MQEIRFIITDYKVRGSLDFFIDTSFREIKGRVIDSKTGEPVLAATVIIEGTQTGNITGETGHFILRIPDSIANHKIVLLISNIGYLRKKVLIKPKNLQLPHEFLLTRIHP